MWVEAISKQTKVSVDDLWRIARSASRRYYEFTIKKADGTDRLIQHPSRSLKALQRLINRTIVSQALTHESATAYEKGSKIFSNANRHLGTKFTTRLDFEDFFHSFDSMSVSSFFRSISKDKSLDLSNSDIDFLTKISCRFERLVIGAPSSPKITNAMMYHFDVSASKIADKYGVVYTRYADDIFISSFKKDILEKVEIEILELVKIHTIPKLKLRPSKTLHLSKAGHRSVTGLVITSVGQISLGRKRKREIRTLTFLALSGNLSKQKLQTLSGLLAFANDNEPEFVARLSKKFGLDIVTWFKAGCPQV